MSRDSGLDRWGMTSAGHFVACIVDTLPSERHEAVEILIQGSSRAEVVKHYQALGYHSIRLKGDQSRVPKDYELAVLASDHDVLWRPFVRKGPWRPWPL